MDSRLCPTSFTQADPGDMFIVRNPGNMMPHSQLFGESYQSALSERAALELAVSSGVEHVAVCGHSNCKVIYLPTLTSIMCESHARRLKTSISCIKDNFSCLTHKSGRIVL